MTRPLKRPISEAVIGSHEWRKRAVVLEIKPNKGAEVTRLQKRPISGPTVGV